MVTLFGDALDDTVGETWCCHNDTHFEGDLCGNMLCGGDKCEAKDTNYGFSIKEMNTFTIIIQDQ